MKKIFAKSFSLMVVISILFSLITVNVHAEAAGVSNLTAKRSGNSATITWVNPTDAGFIENELYVTKKGNTTLITTTAGQTSATYDVTEVVPYTFTVKSYYTNDVVVEKSASIFRSPTLTNVFNGWSLDVVDFGNTDAFRGTYNVAEDEVYSGSQSAHFKVNQNREDNVYMRLFKSLSVPAGRKYCYSFWFKTNDYGTNGYRSRVVYRDPVTDKDTSLEITNAVYPNGEWHNFKTYFTLKTAATRTFFLQAECYGDIWFDNIEIFEVDENNERIGNTDILQNIGTFEQALGVTGLTASRTNNTATVSWTNPTNSDFLYNELYVKYNGEEKLVNTFVNNEKTTTYDVTASGGYRFTLKSYYEGGATAVKDVALFRPVNDTKTFNGWGLDVVDNTNTDYFRGSYGLASEGADGDYSAYFNVHHTVEGNVYFKLFRTINLTAGRTYCYTYKFKTTDYVANSSRIVFYNPSTNAEEKMIIKDNGYSDGVWNEKKVYFTATGNKAFYFTVDAFGELWLDDIQVYEVEEFDGEYEIKSGNLLIVNGVNYGSFEQSGVTNFSYTSANSSEITLTWNNPTSSIFKENKLYLEENGQRTLIETFVNGETSYTYTGAVANKLYQFVMVSTLGDKTKEVSIDAYSKRVNQTDDMAPGWRVEYRDTNPARYRGKVGVDTNVAHSGNSSLFFSLEEPMQGLVYNKLYKPIALEGGKTYSYSAWIRTDGYGEGATRFSAMINGISYTYTIDLPNQKITNPITGVNDDFDNGVWYKIQAYFTANQAGNKEFSFIMDSKGTMWIDDIEIYEVEDFDGEYEIIGQNLLAPSNGKIGGDFEFDLVCVTPNINIENGIATADAYIGNCFMMKPESKIFLAEYTPGNKLVRVSEKTWAECMPEDKEYTAYEGNMIISAPCADGNYVKAFVWNGMTPLCIAAE